MPRQALAVFVGGLLCGLVLRSNDDDGAPRRRRLVGGERSDELQTINARLDALTLGLEALLEAGARRPLVDGAGALAGRASLAALMDAYVGEHDGERSKQGGQDAARQAACGGRVHGRGGEAAVQATRWRAGAEDGGDAAPPDGPI